MTQTSYPPGINSHVRCPHCSGPTDGEARCINGSCHRHGHVIKPHRRWWWPHTRTTVHLNDLIENNKLRVTHEEGRHETPLKAEIDPAGNLVIWIE